MLGRLTALVLTAFLTCVGWLSVRWWPESESEAQTTPPTAPPLEGLTPPARPGTHQVKLNGHTFTLPDGFTIELVAGPPHAERPIVAALDDKGRLYVCDSSGSNEKVAEQVKKKPHRIVRLESTRGDGVFDKSTVFVPNVMFPEGAMWLAGSLYVAAPPQILKFTDTDGDGKADKEEVWFDGKTLTGCANDLHGPYLGPDGWVYWCKGAFAKQEYTLPGGRKLGTRAAHIFRARPDGTNIEPVMTGGMDNPVDVVFTPGGERIFSTTFFQHPRDGRRDGLVHAVYGGVYGKDHDPVYEHPWTSPHLMPVLTHMGPAAPCGLHRYESDQFGTEYENNVFCCQFNMRKVSRHVLVPSGSTFVTKDSDFVVSDNLDFHPTDVIEDADGSLLIIDTGGWYKLCCPTSQLVKPDVTGAIYRVRKVGAHKVDDPRGEKIDWMKLDDKALTWVFDDRRPVVRWKAIDALAARGKAALPMVEEVLSRNRPSEATQLGVVWAAARVGGPDAATAALQSLRLTGNTAVHEAAFHVAALYRPAGAVETVAQYVRSGQYPPVRRVAAEALGRIGDPKAIPWLLEALADEQTDRALDHSLTYALIEIGDPKETAKGLAHKSPRVRRAVLAALDAMPDGKLDPKAALAELDSPDAALRETAWWIAGRHPDWGGHLARRFRTQLSEAGHLKPPARDELTDRLVKFAKNPAVQQAIVDGLTQPSAGQVVALRAMARSGLKAMPEAWTAALRAAAPKLDDRDVLREALAALRAVPPSAKDFDTFTDALPRAALWPTGVVPDEFRLAMLSARPPGTGLPDAVVAYLSGKLDREESPAARAAAVDALGRAALSAAQLKALPAVLKTVGPVEAGKVIDLFGKTKDEAVGLALVAALRDPAVRAVLRADQVKPVLDKYGPAVQKEAAAVYAAFEEARKGETAKLERLLKEMPAGDVRRGQLVFNGTKGQCAACHKIGYVGGLVGPDLTRIGGIRSERDLLESIVFPSASFVRSYEPVRVTTADGRTLNGILKKDAPDEIILVVAADKEERVARADVESIAPSSVSVMPAGLDQQLTVQELADLVAFLKACK
jgi:putative membrane-bound dehydrogenase-like protein